MIYECSQLKSGIDFAIITIREDEYRAVLSRFKPVDKTSKPKRYAIGTIATDTGGHYRFAVARCHDQGNGAALNVARDLIQYLDPSWLVLVGIAGAVPSDDFSLGDVVCATRVHDYCVQAAMPDGSTQFASKGGPLQVQVEELLSNLPFLEETDFPDWNSSKSIGMPKPRVTLPTEADARVYGSDAWKRKVCETLATHFPAGKRPRRPLATSRPVASNDALMKNPAIMHQWLDAARDLAAVEMELAGVYAAARQPDREYPILAIRGISDVVGFKRDNIWTKYACESAAAFTRAIIISGNIIDARPGVFDQGLASDQALAKQQRVIFCRNAFTTPCVSEVNLQQLVDAMEDVDRALATGTVIDRKGRQLEKLPPANYSTDEAKAAISLVRATMQQVRIDTDCLRDLLLRIFGTAGGGMLLNAARELADQKRVGELHELFQAFDRIDDLRNRVLTSFNKLLPAADQFASIPLSSDRAREPISWPSLIKCLRGYEYNAKGLCNPSETSSWKRLNRRRLNLIDKEVDRGLTAEEATELCALQKDADAYLDIVAPLPFEIFEKLRECAKEDGLDVSFLKEE